MYPLIEKPIWTYIFILACVVMFILQNLTQYWIYLAFFPYYAFKMPWTFITSIFLHADFEHLLFNMIALFFFGLGLENIVGRKLFAIIFIISGIIGNLGYLIADPFSSIPGIGASGAIYGIVGTLVILTPFRRVFLYGLFPIPLILLVILWALIDFAGLFSPSTIAHSAHLAGLIIGILFGLYLRKYLVKVEYY
ncbi:MAG: rhomboid family intramembrane serine protease [Nitrososphaeria archaeon]|nr:rhomboid family intramembrane serine protease [Nitrososphaeria archaeon]